MDYIYSDDYISPWTIDGKQWQGFNKKKFSWNTKTKQNFPFSLIKT